MTETDRSGSSGTAATQPTRQYSRTSLTLDRRPGSPQGRFSSRPQPPAAPGIPAVRLSPAIENHAATLVWDAVLAPLPAAKYKVLKGADAAGPFAEIAEVTATTYRDINLPNGVPVHYVVVSVAGGGQTSVQSNVVSATPSSAQAGIAYVVPEGVPGNQNYAGEHWDALRCGQADSSHAAGGV